MSSVKPASTSTPTTHIVVLLYLDSVQKPLVLPLPYPLSKPLTPSDMHFAFSVRYPYLIPTNELYALPLVAPVNGFRTVVAGRKNLFKYLEEVYDSTTPKGSDTRKTALETRVDSLELRLATTESRLASTEAEIYTIKSRHIEARAPIIFYSIRVIVCRRLKGKDVVADYKTGPHPAIAELEDAAHGGPTRFKPLVDKSRLAIQFFTPAAVTIFNSVIDRIQRHQCAHGELDPVKLLDDCFFLELVQRAKCSGDKRMCPASIALRFLLLAWGPAVARGYREVIRANNEGLFYPLDDDQQERLEMFFL